MEESFDFKASQGGRHLGKPAVHLALDHAPYGVPWAVRKEHRTLAGVDASGCTDSIPDRRRQESCLMVEIVGPQGARFQLKDEDQGAGAAANSVGGHEGMK